MVRKGGHLSAEHKLHISQALKGRKHKARKSNTSDRIRARQHAATESHNRAFSAAAAGRSSRSFSVRNSKHSEAMQHGRRAATHEAVARALELKQRRVRR